MKASKERLEQANIRAKELLEKMTLTEKIGQLSQYGTSIYNDEVDYYFDHYDEGRIGSYLTVSGAETTNMLQKKCKETFPTPIPLLFGEDVIHGYKTTFPTPLAQSCSWNPALAKKGAEAAAKEASAAGIRWVFSPMVDIARDPRWGRIVEGYGEDPYLCSRFSEAVVEGYQGEEIGAENHVLACMKHFAGYGAAVGGRDYNEVEMSEQTFYDVYLPPFQAGIRAGAATVMCGFHSLNGVPCTGSKYLMKKILRDECGFDGFVVSDAGSVDQMVPHGFAEDTKEACKMALEAGVNMLMAGDHYHNTIPEFIREGKMTEADVDALVFPILVQKLLLGLFENPYVEEAKAEEVFFCPEHMETAEKMAEECIVLLENNGILPLNLKKKVALIGPIADDREHVLGTWACQKDPSKTVSILQGMRNAGFSVAYEKGCDIESGTEEELERAVTLAKENDVVILALGESFEMSGEAKSRANLTLPEVQCRLFEKVVQTGVPVILLISAGRPIVVEGLREKTAALAYIWQLGSRMGDAVAKMLSGETEVSGRLSVSVPRCVGQVPVHYNHPNTGHPYFGKVWYETCYIDESIYPRYPFGYGLSYTQFELSELELSKTQITCEESLSVSCMVRNIGKRVGKTVLQLYVRDLVGSIVRPVKELKGFEKITLEPGERRRVTFRLSKEMLAFHNRNMDKVVEPGKFYVWVGEHSDDERLKAEFSLI